MAKPARYHMKCNSHLVPCRPSTNMVVFFALFIVVAFLTVLGGFIVNPEFVQQRDELLPLQNYEPFVYVYLIIAGLSIELSFRSQHHEWFASIFLFPFAGAISGWSFGLALMDVMKGNWQEVMVGLACTFCISMFSLVPVLLVRQASTISRDVLGRWFRNSLHVLMVHGIVIIFVVAGVIGLWGFYTRLNIVLNVSSF